MSTSAVEAVRRACAESTFLRRLAEIASRHLASDGYRALRDDEIEQLKAQHVGARDWSEVLVAPDFRASRVVNTWFAGPARLGVFKGRLKIADGGEIGSGIYNADLSHVTIGDGALVSNTSLMCNTFVGEKAVVLNCGEVTCAAKTSYGNGQTLPLANQTGSRGTRVYADITVAVAAAVCGRRDDPAQIKAYEKAVEAYLDRATGGVTVIDDGAMAKHTPKLADAFVGAGALVEGATLIQNATLLSTPDEPVRVIGGGFVKQSLLQWGSEVDSMGLVERSVLCEHSRVERHGKLADALLGPNSTVGSGECSASLCGPFVGFHHQALLIAAYWPEGKGNLSYGANVGSNHTSKAPDQECFCGEGTFFGLGSCIKYPANFTLAPYTLVASGVIALSQKLELPFALLNTPGEFIEGVSPAYNEILPGWMLSDNIYAVRRNEAKYRLRNRATREAFDFEVFRPAVVDRMLDARLRLKAAEGTAERHTSVGEAVYIDRQVPGLGKNYLREAARAAGVEAYTFYIRHYALKGLLTRLAGLPGADAAASADALLAEASDDPRWEHERRVLNAEFPGEKASKMLDELVAAQERIAADTQASKEKDDRRGARVIDDYADAHGPAEADPVVKAAWAEAEAVKAAVAKFKTAPGT